MGKHERIELDLGFRKPCKYIKFVPTAFREEPINYTMKQFHSHRAECQFFGISGYELINDYKLTEECPYLFDGPDLNVAIQTQVIAGK